MPRSSSSAMPVQTLAAARALERAFGPGLGAGVARLRNRVELPDQAAVCRAEGPDRTGVRVRVLVRREAEDQLVLEDESGHGDEDDAGPVDVRRQVEDAAVAEALDQAAVGGVERDQVLAVGVEEPPLGAVLPPHEAALGVAGKLQIAAPDLLARGGVEREGVEMGREGVEHPVDDQGARVHRGAGAPGFARVVDPGDLELAHVVPVDLGQRAVVPASGVAQVHGPVFVGRAAGGEEENRRDGDGQVRGAGGSHGEQSYLLAEGRSPPWARVS